MACALGLRVILVVRGGQMFWPDESRYLWAHEFLKRIYESGPAGLEFLLEGYVHIGFVILAVPPAFAQRIIQIIASLPTMQTLWLPALFFSMASVASIGLVYAAARRAGAPETEAFLAALLMASSSTMFYFSRHLLPYDSSLALALAALVVGLGPDQDPRRSVLCGSIATLSFLAHNGHWTIVLVVILLHALYGPRLADAVWRGAIAAGSILGWFLLFDLATVLRGKKHFIGVLVWFSGTVNQGDFSEGWSLPWLYLWEAEHGLLLVWLASTVGALVWCAQTNGAPRRVWLWLAAIAMLYGLLCVTSVGLHRFVVYGRLARQMTPFFCLVTAAVLWRVGSQRRFGRLAGMAALLLALQVGINFYEPLSQHFPREFENEVRSRYGEVRRDVTIPSLGEPASKPAADGDQVLLNAQFLYPSGSEVRKPVEGETLMRASHPLQYRPYLYELYTPLERSIFTSNDISMRLVRMRVVGPR